jgi:hypothetical protein
MKRFNHPSNPDNPLRKRSIRRGLLGKMQLLPLVAATYFMVCGGAYGIEDILGGAGYGVAILILLVMPFLWSLPTALMVGELASALPVDGGFYVWVRRAMGPFWGYQEGWLSLAASIFDMAIYPAIFVSYLGKFDPALTAGWHHFGWALLVVAACTAWNLLGAPSVGHGAEAFFVLLIAPFVALTALGFWHGSHAHAAVHWGGAHSSAGVALAIQVAMWNYMGWDNAATVAGEVENPQRNYPVDAAGGGELSAAAVRNGCSGDCAGQLFDRRLDGCGRAVGRTNARLGDDCRWSDQRLRDVQRAGVELYSATHGHGRGWNAAGNFCPAQPARCALGIGAAMRRSVGGGAQSSF